MSDNTNTATAWIRKSQRSVYHTNPDCRYVTSEHREMRLDQAREWYEECKICSGDYDPHTGDSRVTKSTNAIDK
jgi:hypothetical protein